jgi:hypothetical protein
MAVVTAEVEEGPQLEKLRVLHEAFVAERPAWVERIEVMYVDRDVLRTLADRPRGRLAGLPRRAASPPRRRLRIHLDWHSVTTQGRDDSLGPAPLDLGLAACRRTTAMRLPPSGWEAQLRDPRRGRQLSRRRLSHRQ